MSKTVAQFMGEIATQLEEQRGEVESWGLRHYLPPDDYLHQVRFEVFGTTWMTYRLVTIGPMDVREAVADAYAELRARAEPGGAG